MGATEPISQFRISSAERILQDNLKFGWGQAEMNGVAVTNSVYRTRKEFKGKV